MEEKTLCMRRAFEETTADDKIVAAILTAAMEKPAEATTNYQPIVRSWAMTVMEIARIKREIRKEAD